MTNEANKSTINLFCFVTIMIVALVMSAVLMIDDAYAAEKTKLINAQNEFEKICNNEGRSKGKTIVTRKDGCSISINEVLKDATYDGTAYNPPVSVDVCDNSNTIRTIKQGTDYTVSYQNNTNAGTAIIRITGIGDYYGTIDIPFTIKPCRSIHYWLDNLDSKQRLLNGKVGNLINSLYANRDELCTGNHNVLSKRKYTGAPITYKQIYATSLHTNHYFNDTGDLYPPEYYSNETYTLPNSDNEKVEYVLEEGKDYTIAYSDNLKVGKATVSFTPKGNYAGPTKKEYFSIVENKNVAKGKIISLRCSGRKVIVRYSKIDNATGYRIAFKKKGGKWKCYNTTSLTKTFSGLKYNKKYIFKVRAYKVISGKKYYGAWSTIKKITVKKTVKTTLLELKPGKTYKTFDVTNDGKRDKIKIKKTIRGSDNGQEILIYVNGKRKIRTGVRRGVDAFMFAKGRKAIIITQTYYMGGASDLYSYPYFSHRFHKNDLSITGCYYQSMSRSNKGLVVIAQPKFGSWTETFSNCQRMPFCVQMKYSLKKGKLKKQSTYPITRKNPLFTDQTTPSTMFYAWQDFRCAASLSKISTKNGMSVYSGDLVTFNNMVFKNNQYYYRISVNDKSGWIKDSDAYAFGFDY